MAGKQFGKALTCLSALSDSVLGEAGCVITYWLSSYATSLTSHQKKIRKSNNPPQYAELASSHSAATHQRGTFWGAGVNELTQSNQMTARPIRVRVFCAVLMICTIGPVFAASDESVLERYRSVQGYGSVEFVRGDTEIPESVVQSLKDYARSVGIRVVDSDRDRADTLIVISRSSSDGSVSATRYRESRIIDMLERVPATANSAKLIVDELLLLWHPPNSNSKRIRGSVDYILKPTFYEPRVANPFSGPLGVAYCNAQRLHKLDTVTPTFSWESFPRAGDLTSGLEHEHYENVFYEFRLHGRYQAANEFLVTGLVEPMYTIDEPLNFCQIYSWSVRAVFTLDDVPRHTEWAGFYYKFSKPWYARRNLKKKWADPNRYACPYLFLTPKSPFDDSCTEKQALGGARR